MNSTVRYTLVVFVQGPLVLGAGQFAWFRVAFTPQGPSIVPEEAESSRKALIQLGVAHTLQLYPMDHGISADMQTDFLQWLAQLK